MFAYPVSRYTTAQFGGVPAMCNDALLPNNNKKSVLFKC